MAGQVNTRVSSTVSKILQGSGKFSIDSVEMGGYQGGVVVTWNQTEVFVESDWNLGPVDSEIQSVEMTVSTEFEEATLETIAAAWGLNSSSVTSNTSSKVLDLTPASSMIEHILTFEGMSGTDRNKLRLFTCNKAVRVGSSATTLNRGVKTTVPCTFRCLLDANGTFGEIMDTTLT